MRDAYLRRAGLGAVVCLLCLTLVSGAAWAQAVSTAQITGTVKDPSGAVLPGAEVTVTQADTGLKRNAVTDETGSYLLTNLPIGPYQLEAVLPGFRTYVQTGIVLQVNSNPLINVTLQVGQVAETIEVQANAALVETRTSGVGAVMDNIRVLELPLNGRQVTDLILISGAAVQGTSYTMGARGYNQVAISVAGGQGSGATYLLDGGTHNDPYTGLGVTMPFPDALQEFKLETNALPAQYGQHSAAAVNAVTKSGTNDIHGDLFEFVRNGRFNARNTFAPARDTLKRNQFGGTVGGPIRKNKFFFFAGHQTTTERSTTSDNLARVPTPAMVQGDFTTFASAACNGGRALALKAPIANQGTDSSGNTIYRVNPASLSPAALNLVKRLPTPPDPCGQVRFSRGTANNEHISVGRLDYQSSEKHSVFGRYFDSRVDNPTDYDGSNGLTVGRSSLKSRIYSFVLGDTYLIATNMISSFRGTMNRTKNEAKPDYFDLNDLGVRGIYNAEPHFVLITVQNGFNIGSGNTIRTDYNTTAYQFAEDISVIRGAHQIAFGANYIRSHENTHLGLSRNPRPMFNSSAAGSTGSGLSDLMLGIMSTMVQGGTGLVYKRQHYIGTYAQDTWKVNPRFTISAGIRWEPYLPPIHKQGYTVFFDQASFDQGTHSGVYKNAPAGLKFPGDPGVPGYKYSNNLWDHFAPRLGVVWDPKGDGRMTIRSAYGIFYELPYFQKSGPVLVAAPYAGQLQLPVAGQPTPLLFDEPWQNYPGGSPFPINLSKPFFPLGGSYPVYPTTVRNPYVHQWNLSIQRQLGPDWLVSANYLGTQTTHLWSSYEKNPVIVLPGASCVIGDRTFTPCSSRSNYAQRRSLYLQNPDQGQYYGVVSELDDGATASYEGLLLSVQRRARNMTVQGNYTLSHCISDTEEAQLGIPTQYNYPGRRYYYRGNCNQDRRHNFNLSTVYQTPTFANSAVRVLAGGWRVSGIVRISSGSYMTITSGVDTSLTQAFGGDRANQVLPNPYAPNRNIDTWLNRAAFGQPADGEWGNMGSNNVVGPGRVSIDMGLTRAFKTHENQSLEFRAEAFNLPNHVNPNNPTTVLNNQNFGKITTAGDPRILQFAVKYVF